MLEHVLVEDRLRGAVRQRDPVAQVPHDVGRGGEQVDVDPAVLVRPAAAEVQSRGAVRRQALPLALRAGARDARADAAQQARRPRGSQRIMRPPAIGGGGRTGLALLEVPGHLGHGGIGRRGHDHGRIGRHARMIRVTLERQAVAPAAPSRPRRARSSAARSRPTRSARRRARARPRRGRGTPRDRRRRSRAAAPPARPDRRARTASRSRRRRRTRAGRRRGRRRPGRA